MRGGFADVAPTGLTILAERAVPLEEFGAAQIAADIEDAEDEVAHAKTDEGRRLAAEKRDQLIEVKGALKIRGAPRGRRTRGAQPKAVSARRVS